MTNRKRDIGMRADVEISVNPDPILWIELGLPVWTPVTG